MTSITRSSSGALANVHRAPGAAPADPPARTSVATTSHAAQHALLSDRPPSPSPSAAGAGAGAGVDRPRLSLNSIRLVTLKKLADIAPDAATSTASTVCQQANDGTITLRGSYPAAALRAASMAAAQGVLALQRDAAWRTDSLGTTAP